MPIKIEVKIPSGELQSVDIESIKTIDEVVAAALKVNLVDNTICDYMVIATKNDKTYGALTMEDLYNGAETFSLVLQKEFA
jgi:hypothetical protein